MSKFLTEWLEKQKAISGFQSDIDIASSYVASVGKCVGPQCEAYFGNSRQTYEEAIKEAEGKTVYTNPEMVIESSSRSFDGLLPNDVHGEFPEHTLLGFRNIITTPAEDRDTDILRTAGAIVDKDMPLLWQHLHTMPIGKMVAVVDHTDSVLRVVSALLDLNHLTEDAAKLIEAGALRISHGFKAIEWKLRKGPDGEEPKGGEFFGFEITKFEIMEESAVSVPSLTGAVIEMHSRGKLHSDAAKGWAKSLDEDRTDKTHRIGFDVKDKFIREDTFIHVPKGANWQMSIEGPPTAPKTACPCNGKADGQPPAAAASPELGQAPSKSADEPVDKPVDKPEKAKDGLETLLRFGTVADFRRARSLLDTLISAEESAAKGREHRELVGSK